MNTEQTEATLTSLLNTVLMVILPIRGTVIQTFYGYLKQEPLPEEIQDDVGSFFHLVSVNFPYVSQVSFRANDVASLEQAPSPVGPTNTIVMLRSGTEPQDSFKGK